MNISQDQLKIVEARRKLVEEVELLLFNACIPINMYRPVLEQVKGLLAEPTTICGTGKFAGTEVVE